MKKLLRKISSFLFSRAVIISGILELRTKYILKNNIPIAIYFHNPDEELFDNIVQWFLKKGFKFLPVNDFLNVVQNKTKIKGAAWISFDDGYEENMTNVLPVLNKYNVPATFFIPSKSVEDGYFWWDFAVDFSKKSKERNLWKIPNSERVEIISKVNKENASFPKRAISLKSLKNLASNPLVTIGNHTDDHVICINCSNEELSRELQVCEEKLTKWVGDKYVKIFSFTNGDYNERVRCVLRDNNFTASFSNDPRPVAENEDPFLIPRMGVVDNIPFDENLLHAVGIWQPVINKFKKITGKG